MRALPAPLGALVSLVLATAAVAHHSFGAIYDSSRQISLEGTVREFVFVHPHPVLVVDVPAADGKVQTWRAEMDNRFELEEIGVGASTFRGGDKVRISGSPGRRQAGILYLWKLERPADGLRYEQVGTTPYLRDHRVRRQGDPQR